MTFITPKPFAREKLKRHAWKFLMKISTAFGHLNAMQYTAASAAQFSTFVVCLAEY